MIGYPDFAVDTILNQRLFDHLAAIQTKSRWSEMKQAQVDEMTSTAARLERDLQPGRWDDGGSDEEASCHAEVQSLNALCRIFFRELGT